jgi:small-conductance mechanosensitive channel
MASIGSSSHGVAGQRSLMVWQVLSALLLLAMGGIHLYLVLDGVGGLLGVLFVLNAVGGLVLAIAMIAAPRRFLAPASALSLVFMAGTLLALVLALTVGLFGITEQLSGQLVSTTIVVESIGIIVLVMTTVLAVRRR